MSIESIFTTGQRLVASTLLDTCQIQDRAVVKDDTGGRAEVFTERADTLSCRFVQLTDRDAQLELDAVFGRAEARCVLPVGTEFAEGDRIHNLANETLWRIVGVLTPASTLLTQATALVRQEVT